MFIVNNKKLTKQHKGKYFVTWIFLSDTTTTYHLEYNNLRNELLNHIVASGETWISYITQSYNEWNESTPSHRCNKSSNILFPHAKSCATYSGIKTALCW